MALKNHFETLPEIPTEELNRIESYNQKYHYEILSVNVKLHDKVQMQQLLAKFGIFLTKTKTRVWMADIKANIDGKIKKVNVTVGCHINPGQALFIIEYCPHEIEYDGLCCTCGQDITSIHEKNPHLYHRKTAALIIGGANAPDAFSSLSSSYSSSFMNGNGTYVTKQKVLRLTNNALYRTSEENSEHLLQQRKLALVLDIDHTFLHATRDPQALQVAENALFSHNVHSFVLPGHKAPYYIKLRPGFLEFLQSVQKFYEIHLYTMSMRKYAEEIVKYIDQRMLQLPNAPTNTRQQLIKNLVTRDDVPSNKKYLHCIYPCDDRMVMIVDDRVDVWPNAVNNVIQIHKYLFWPSEDASLSHTRMHDRMGVTTIALTSTINRTSEAAKRIRKYCIDFFRDLGVYEVEIEPDSVQIFTHRSPDQTKLRKFQQNIADNANSSWLEPLQNSKIEYKVNFTELRRKEGDQVLACLTHVLLEIHKLFFEEWDKIVRHQQKIKNKKKLKVKKNSSLKKPPVNGDESISNEEENNNNNNNNNNKEDIRDNQKDNTNEDKNKNENKTEDGAESTKQENIKSDDNVVTMTENQNSESNESKTENQNNEYEGELESDHSSVDGSEDIVMTESYVNSVTDDFTTTTEIAISTKRKRTESLGPHRPDARKLLTKLKRQVFQGNVFVFSGLFPVDTKLEQTYEWKIAVEFGAKCVKTLSPGNVEKVTHCIAVKMGTNKTNIALECNIEIVHPHWLYNSTTHYMKSDPTLYRPSGWIREKHERKGGKLSEKTKEKQKEYHHPEKNISNSKKRKRTKEEEEEDSHTTNNMDIDTNTDITMEPNSEINDTSIGKPLLKRPKKEMLTMTREDEKQFFYQEGNNNDNYDNGSNDEYRVEYERSDEYQIIEKETFTNEDREYEILDNITTDQQNPDSKTSKTKKVSWKDWDEEISPETNQSILNNETMEKKEPLRESSEEAVSENAIDQLLDEELNALM